jgi:GNAT superfamily N-acetyltransferase
MDLHFTSGNKSEAIDIIREAARWLIDTGKPMWGEDELTDEHFSNPPEEFIVMWDGNQSVAAMTLSFTKNIIDKHCWPEIPPDESGFLHKLSVRRKYAGKGLAARLAEHAKQLCAAKGIRYLRLDCDANREGLMALYKSCDFSLVETKTFHTPKLKEIDVAMFEFDCIPGIITELSESNITESVDVIRRSFATVEREE